MRHIGNEFGAVEMASESSGRFDYRHSVIVKVLDQVCYELGPLVDVIHIERFEKSLGGCLDRSHFHSSVGEEAFVEWHEFHHLIAVFRVDACYDAPSRESQLAC